MLNVAQGGKLATRLWNT